MLLRLALGALATATIVVLPAGPAAAVAGCEDLLLVTRGGGVVRATAPASLGLMALPADAFTAVQDGTPVPVRSRRLAPSEVAVSLLLSSSPGTTARELAAAQAVALEVLVGLPAGVRISLVVGGDPATRLSPLSASRDAAVQALSRPDLSGATDPAAISLALQQLPAQAASHLVVFSDGRSPDPVVAPPGTQVHRLHYGSMPAPPTDAGCPSDEDVALLTAADAVVRRAQGTYELLVPGAPTEIRLRAGQVRLSAALGASPAPVVATGPRTTPSSGAGAGQVWPVAVVVAVGLAVVAAAVLVWRRRHGELDEPPIAAPLAASLMGATAGTRAPPPVVDAPRPISEASRPVPARPRVVRDVQRPVPEVQRLVPTRSRAVLDVQQPDPVPPPAPALPPPVLTAPPLEPMDAQDARPAPVLLQLADQLDAGRPPAEALRALAAVAPTRTSRQLLLAAGAVDGGAELDEALDATAPRRGPGASRIRSDLAEAAWALRLARSTGAPPTVLLRAAADGSGAREDARWEASDARIEAWVMRGCLLSVVPAAVAVRLLSGGPPRSSGLLAALALAAVGAVWVWASTTPPYSPLPWRWRPRAAVVPQPGEVLEDAAVWAVLHDDVRQAVSAVVAEPDSEQARAVVREAGRRVDAGASASQALHELADEAWGGMVAERPRLVLASVPAFVLCLAPAAALVVMA